MVSFLRLSFVDACRCFVATELVGTVGVIEAGGRSQLPNPTRANGFSRRMDGMSIGVRGAWNSTATNQAFSQVAVAWTKEVARLSYCKATLPCHIRPVEGCVIGD
nr:uncharacterized protein LOC112274898 [Physcomitrium patens]|eukprot:XP_024360521.1 uncharacterized protein LOC112274898 [Physcomitrella patens]